MTKKIAHTMASLMLALAGVFLAFALTHPEMSFPWSNTITYALYGGYLVEVAVLYLLPMRNPE